MSIQNNATCVRSVLFAILTAITLLGASSAAFAADRVVRVGVRADSEHFGMEAVLAMDGNPGTFWHSIWRGAVTQLPHEIVVDLGSPYEITGFTCLTRPASCKNGNIKDYEVYLSDRPEAQKPLAKGTPVAKSTFENEVGESVVKFDAPVKGRYFRLRALSNVAGEPTWTGIGELTLHCEGVKFVGESWALARARKLRLPKVIGSHMVLQRDVPPVIWGWGQKGRKVTVALGDDNKAAATTDGRGAWRVTLKAMKADGKAHKLVVIQKTDEGEQKIELDDILIGDVWIGSGQSNMEWGVGRTETAGQAIKKANYPKIRLFHVPRVQVGAPARDVNATWRVCAPQTVPGFSAALYHFGKRLHKDLDVPMGLIHSAWSGSPIEPWVIAGGKGGNMYNGMIAPLVSFPHPRRSSGTRAKRTLSHKDGFAYFDRMKGLIDGWRKAWGTELPVLLRPDRAMGGQGHYAPGQLPALWEAQVASPEDSRRRAWPSRPTSFTASAIFTRATSATSASGSRSGPWLRHTARKTSCISGPLYKSMRVEGNKIRISFAHTGGGLRLRNNQPPNEFQIAGADGKFMPATVSIQGTTILMWSPKVPAPTQVRFGWHKTATPNLMNKEGLPASPFRTNGWHGGTGE